jgi:hypothetical protein
VAFLVAGGTAALLAFLDLTVDKRYRPTLGSLYWWALRLAINAAQGVVAVSILELAAIKASDLSTPILWALAGAFAPRLIQGLQYGGGKVDLKAFLEKFSLPLDEKIDAATAAANSASDLRLTRALIAKNVAPATLAEELVHAMQSRRALQTKLTHVEYIWRIVENGEPAEAQMRQLVVHARELQLLGTVRRLKRHS